MQIHTERLILREFTFDDWPAILAYQSDSRYLRYYAWTERTPEEVQAFVGMFLAQQQEKPRRKFQLAATLKASGDLIGNCGVRLEEAGLPRFFLAHLPYSCYRSISSTGFEYWMRNSK